MSSTTSKTSKTAALAEVQALIAGTEKHFPNGNLTLGNAAYTTATLIQELQNLENALAAMAAAHVQVKEAGVTLTGIEGKAVPLMRDYKKFVQATFSSSPNVLADFGLKPAKVRAPLTSEKRAVATAKMRATRKARGTVGKKQKLAIKGDVTSVSITPVTTPTASPVPVAPTDTTPTAHATSGAAAK